MGSIKFKNDIAYHRKNKKLSQNDLSKILDIDRPTLSKFENGHILPSKDLLESIAKNLNVLISDLYSLELQKIILREKI